MPDEKLLRARYGQLLTHQNQPVKQHIVFDADSRPVFVFTAPRDAADGSPCTVTEYVYLGPNTTLVKARLESVYLWKSAWDTDFTFDPTVDYDPDGNGVL